MIKFNIYAKPGNTDKAKIADLIKKISPELKTKVLALDEYKKNGLSVDQLSKAVYKNYGSTAKTKFLTAAEKHFCGVTAEERKRNLKRNLYEANKEYAASYQNEKGGLKNNKATGLAGARKVTGFAGGGLNRTGYNSASSSSSSSKRPLGF